MGKRVVYTRTPFNTPPDGVSFVLKGSDTHMTNPASMSANSDSMSTDSNYNDIDVLKCVEVLKDGVMYCFPSSPTPIQRISGGRQLVSCRGKLTYGDTNISSTLRAREDI